MPCGNTHTEMQDALTHDRPWHIPPAALLASSNQAFDLLQLTTIRRLIPPLEQSSGNQAFDLTKANNQAKNQMADFRPLLAVLMAVVTKCNTYTEQNNAHHKSYMAQVQ